MKNESPQSQSRERVKVLVKSLGKIASVRRVEHDPVWGKQYLVSTYTPMWGPEWHWVKENDLDFNEKNWGWGRGRS